MAERATSPSAKKPAVKRKARKTAGPEPLPIVPTGAPGYSVFISHSSKESWVARQISKEIENIGLSTWLDDTDLHGGDNIKSAIQRGIRESQEVLVVISVNSMMSQWVIYEAAIAEILGRRITPILNNIGHDVIAPLQGIKGYDLNEFDKFLLELGGRAKRDKRGKE